MSLQKKFNSKDNFVKKKKKKVIFTFIIPVRAGILFSIVIELFMLNLVEKFYFLVFPNKIYCSKLCLASSQIIFILREYN